MSLDILRDRGLPTDYKDNRGNQPVRFGAYLGVVKNNVDPTRSGRLQVFIEALNSKVDENNQSKWVTVAYCPPFYGTISPQQTPGAATDSAGTFTSNPVSYGMWFTPPDIGVTVLVFFLNGDASNGVYTGVVPDQAIAHMVPAIGASANYSVPPGGLTVQGASLSTAKKLPVSELNENNRNFQKDPRFFTKPKPVHTVVASQFFAQGLIDDPTRGPITSSSQRESPSAVYGVSTPGRPVYQGGLNNQAAAIGAAAGLTTEGQTTVVGRQGGHSFVMDDGDVLGQNNLIRLRSSSGHQITMSDDGKSIYVIHANGRTWLELGAEGTVDVFAQNSINLRTKGQLNFHADKDININAGGLINMKSGAGIALESATDISAKAKASITLWTGFKLGLKAGGILTMVSAQGSWNSGKILNLQAGKINLNGGKTDSLTEPENITVNSLPDTVWDPKTGWGPAPKNTETVVTRAPTHEPYPYHNTGVDNSVTKLRLLGDTGDAARTVFTGDIYNQDVAVVDMTAKFAVKQLNLASNPVTPVSAVTAGAAAATAAALTQGQAATPFSNAAFQNVSLSVPQALSIPQNINAAFSNLTDLTNTGSLGQLSGLLNSFAGNLGNLGNLQGLIGPLATQLGSLGNLSNITEGSLNNLTGPLAGQLRQTASGLNNLGVGLISGGGFGGGLTPNINGTITGLPNGLGGTIGNDLSGLLSGQGIGGLLGKQVSTLISGDLGLGSLQGQISSLLAGGDLTAVLSGFSPAQLSNLFGGDLNQLLGGSQAELSALLGGSSGELSALLSDAGGELQSLLSSGELSASLSDLTGALTSGLADFGLADIAIPDIGSFVDFDISGAIGDLGGALGDLGGFGDFGGFGGGGFF
jgi:hypothetical protein